VTSASKPHAPFDQSVRSQNTLILYGMAVATFFAGTIVWTAFRNRPLQLRMVASMAVFESSAIFGLVAAFTANDWRLYVPAWFVTLIGFMRCFPSDAAIEELENARRMASAV
jgi:cytochrome c biogenesis factor